MKGEEGCRSLPYTFCHNLVNAPILIHTHSTLHNQHISPLLRLPAEVRNIIYVLVLGNRTYRFHDAVSRPHAQLRTNNECHVLALLLVSHQIYAEARLLPYSLNTFSFRECEISLMPFLAHRHLAHLRAIRFIELVTFQAARMWAAPNVNSGYKHLVKVRLLERLPNLTQIKVLVYGYSTLYVNSSMLSIEPSFTKIGENQRRLEEMVMNVREDVIVRFFWV
jgi:hypothetical protein